HPYELDIGPGYLSVLGVPLLAGRHLADPDLNPPAGQPVAVLVNRLFARGYFGSANPLGRIVGAAHGLPGFRIVGVVGDARFASQRRPVAPTIFTPGYGGRVYFTLRSSLPAVALLPAVRAAVAHVDGNLPLVDVKTQRQNQLQLLFQERLLARLGGFFGGLALLLAALGLYGLLAHEVARRQREIGIRIALGANRAHLLRRVVGRGVGLTAIGLALGAVGGWATLRVLDSILFEVQPADPASLAGAGLLLLIAAAAASSIPARRALRCHPAEALRAE
ncbi:MAG: FtsX-like permease family protein, partial [Terriglobales bacterium]